MNDSPFFDTSVLVYAFDTSEMGKRRASEKLIEAVFSGESMGVLSNQILAELFNVLTTKIANKLSGKEAEEIVNDFIYSENWKKLDYKSSTVTGAMFLSASLGAPFWDALIANTMIQNGVSTIITENYNDFKRIPGIKIIDPFRVR